MKKHTHDFVVFFQLNQNLKNQIQQFNNFSFHFTISSILSSAKPHIFIFFSTNIFGFFEMMSNEDEKRCPLCAEEMDWTDQQFKPCKCGYQVCVWCWHHIMDMAEKDDIEGGVTLCRTDMKRKRYSDNANQIVKGNHVLTWMASKDFQQEKINHQKRSPESKMKYITYSKEDAIRCIQSIHGFNMDGRLLRASFGTAKYCHAWLRNLPCNNPGCLYLHSFGAEEDSFSKDEAAAVQTRRSGNVLPPPVDELNNTTSASNLDPSPVGMSSSCHVSNMLQSNIKDVCIGAPNKITTFVDVVGRPNSSDSEKDGNIVEDKRILNLCSDLSSLTFDKDLHDKKPYSGHRLYKASSSDHLMKGFHVESTDIPNAPYREDFRYLNIQGSNSCNHMSHRSFLHTSCPKDIQEDSVGQFSLYEMSHSASNYSKEHNSVPIQEDGAPPSITSVNSVPDDRFLETKFQSSAKTDRIYREILDIGDDLSKLPNSLSEIDDDSNKFHHSPSWNSQNSDNTCFPFVKQDIYATQMADYGTSFSNNSRHMSSNCSLHLDLGESQDHYSYKSQIPASKPQIIAPPGFSKPRRDPPLGFPASKRRDHFSRVSSGNHLMDNSAFLTTFLQNPSTNNGTFGDIDFNDPAILTCGKSRTANGLSSIGFELKGTSPLPQNGFGDEERLWNLMQQSNSAHIDFKLTQSLLPQAPSTQQQTWHRSQNGDCISNLDGEYGFSSRLTEQRQAYDPSSLTSLSQQNFPNGHISSNCQYSSDDQLRNEVSMPDIQRNGSLGFSKYFPGYGDMRFQMPVSGDVYTRLFGM
ncbi:hypothetical protein Leryth_020189 [Lithospermum erythrorhizon]|nr:hypothetical protein Leryth_020189 [Lithospermum erythrorhizon]